LSWSPDGSRIAFVSGRQIYAVNTDGSGLTRLTSDAGQDQWPSWSPDGSTIAYSNSGRTPLDDSCCSPTQEIYTIPAAGGTPTRLTHDRQSDDAPAYSPDGSRIAFLTQGGIWVMDANGQNAHPLRGQPKGANFDPRWSPDGSRLLLMTYYPQRRARDGGPLLTIHVVNVSTGTSARLPGLVESSKRALSWLPSGDAVLVDRYAG
jgi:TolB protein